MKSGNKSANSGIDLGAAAMEAVGLFYGGFVIMGMSVGMFAGFFIGGGREFFLLTGWVETLIGAATGVLLGIGFGLISHGLIAYKNSKNK